MRKFLFGFVVSGLFVLNVRAQCQSVLLLAPLIARYQAQPYSLLEGSGWSHILKGVNHDGEPVFIKVMNPATRKLSDFQNEVRILEKLKETVYGDSLLATEVLADGRRALVLKFYDLKLTLPSSWINTHQVAFLKVNAETILAQVEFILADLNRRKIVPMDFQVGVTTEGRVVLLDVEAYRRMRANDNMFFEFSRQKILNFLAPYRASYPESR